jgi:WD40 repeat protein
MKLLKTLSVFLILFQSVSAQSPEISITTGHATFIMRIALAPKGNLVASNGPDHLIKIWDRSSGKEITVLNNKVKGVDNEQRISDIRFFDDGKHLLSTDENGAVKVWNIKEEKALASYKGVSGLPGLSADIADRRIVFLNDGYSLSYADMDDFKEHKIEDVTLRILKLNPSNPNEIFAVDLQNNFFIYDFIQKVKVRGFEKTETYVFSAAYSNDGKHIAVLMTDMRLKIWNTKTGSLVKELSGLKPLKISFHPTSNELVILNQDLVSQEGSIIILDNKNFNEKRRISTLNLATNTMDISHNGRYIAVNSMEFSNNSTSYTIDILNFQNEKTIQQLKSKAHTVYQIAAAKNSPRIFALYNDMNVRVWNIATLQIERVIQYIQNICISNDGSLLAMRGYHEDAEGFNAIIFYHPDSLTEKSYIPCTDLLSDMKISKDNKHIIAAAIGGTISVWNIQTKEKVYDIPGTSSGNMKVALSPDLKYIAYGSSGTPGVFIYNTKTKETLNITEIHPYLGVSDLEFSSDSQFLMTGSFDNEVKLLEVGTWTVLNSYKGNLGPVYNLSVNPADSFIVCATAGSAVTESDYAVNLWDRGNESLKCNFLGHKLTVNSTDFSNDYNFVFSGSMDGTVKIWSVDSCKEILSCIAVGYDEYIFVTPDFHYTGSKDALKGVGFKMDGERLYPFEQYDLRLNRPDVIAERLNIASQNMIRAFKRAYQKRLEKMGFNQNMLEEEYSLPELVIHNKSDIGFQTTENELLLDISAKDNNHALDRINVWINDVPVYGREGIDIKENSKELKNKKIKLALSAGKNKIQISVLNSKGIESLKETIDIMAPVSSVKPDLYIIAVGISDYHDDDIDLNYAAKDASDISALFEQKTDKFGKIEIIKVLDHDATKENILKTKETLQKTDINDLVIIYTAGHGFLDDNLDYFFATTDVDVMDPSAAGLPYDELEDLLDDIPARKKLLLMDACHSGEIDYDEYDLYVENMYETNVVARSVYTSRTSESNIGLENSFRLMKELFADLRRGSGAIVISSAGGVEFAFESDKLKNGVFTYVLMNALRSMRANENNDSVITISELQKYVMKTVSELTAGRQNPTTRRENLEFDFEVW